jgi:carbamate kinase
MTIEDAQPLVIALGGNAISMAGEQGTIEQQFARTRETARVLCDVLDQGYRFVLTHGNGPQVGNILRRVEIASDQIYTIPLEVCVADTQAGMGYMIAQCLMNELTDRGASESVTTIVTSVEVDSEDKAFASPSKPIGPRLRQEEAQLHKQRDGWKVSEVAKANSGVLYPAPGRERFLKSTPFED